MADESSEEKSHEPTDKRKRDAREDGQVLTSKESFVFVTLAAGTGLLAISVGLGPMLMARWREYFRFGNAPGLDHLLTERLTQFWTEFLLAGLAFALPIAAAIVGLQLAMGGISFSTKAMSPKFSRIDPLSGMGRMVSMNALVELSKGILKVSALGGLAFFSLGPQLSEFGALSGIETSVGIGYIWQAMITLLAWLCLGLAGIGAIDLAWQIISMRKKLMMSFQEVKEESKEANGSPEVKGRLRRLQMEASQRGAQQRAALVDVPKATAIVTNPTHFAVALRYVPGETTAPIILAMGKGPMAQEIIGLGKGAGIRVLQSPPLARALYYTGEIGAEIREQLFGAVAAILAHVYRLDRGEYEDMPEVDLPDELYFNEFGRPMNGGKDGKAS